MRLCPNCDHDWVSIEQSPMNGLYATRCNSCGMQGPPVATVNKSMEAWDALPRRGDDAKLRAELAKAKRIIHLAVDNCGKSCIPCGRWLDDAQDWAEKEKGL